MNRFGLATAVMLAGVLLAAGCASPCGCGGGFHRMSMFRAHTPCPCECCSNVGGGVPIVGAASPMLGEGPFLEPPGLPQAEVPSPALPPSGLGMPSPLPPSLGSPAVPANPGRLSPIPNAAQPFPAESSSRRRRR